MKTEYRVWRKPHERASHTQGDRYPDLATAKATLAPQGAVWATNGEGNHWPDMTDRPALAFVAEEQVPESVEDRVHLAVNLIVECGWIDGAHHKAWVMDQVVRVLTGDRYEQVVAEATADGSEWDEGIAP
jgi:hypothetical protein